ncbi:hypothetical protein BS50DRAFT_255366 [Corynespora cassiicola Philippines]|uniref:Uncharacterized protein n=1 Tax=Corynespora cassiicola Philippines TaxID=1448308 RepID=A0A2T2P4J3_CORCC|nr:hypothetical protein BS50DRAFT_255366 [Corynespora cassiicola Philippines]
MAARQPWLARQAILHWQCAGRARQGRTTPWHPLTLDSSLCLSLLLSRLLSPPPSRSRASLRARQRGPRQAHNRDHPPVQGRAYLRNQPELLMQRNPLPRPSSGPLPSPSLPL